MIPSKTLASVKRRIDTLVDSAYRVLNNSNEPCTSSRPCLYHDRNPIKSGIVTAKEPPLYSAELGAFPFCQLLTARWLRRSGTIWSLLHFVPSAATGECMMIKTLKAIAAFAVLHVLTSAAGAHAGANLDKIRAAGTLTIGTEGTYAPFTFHDGSGQLVGFDVEIGEEVAKRIGVKAKFIEGKWDGLIAGLRAERYDAVINEVGITEERKAKFDFSDSYVASKAALIVRADEAAIKGFGDLSGKRAAQSLTSNYGKMAEKSGAELVATDGFDQSIALVIQGRADLTINDSLSFLDFKKKQPDAPVKIAATKPDASYSGIIVRKGDPELVGAINEALGGMKADGAYKAIAEKYFGQDVSQ